MQLQYNLFFEALSAIYLLWKFYSYSYSPYNNYRGIGIGTRTLQSRGKMYNNVR